MSLVSDTFDCPSHRFATEAVTERLFDAGRLWTGDSEPGAIARLDPNSRNPKSGTV